MIINHNMNAMNAHRQMTGNTAASGKSMEKLSSGLRINRAGDDAAGLAISEKMRGQIRGLDQASRNSQDGISMIQTAEGALNETHSILQRMRELAVQSSSDTNNDADRGQIQKEITQLKSEIDRISTTTEFNTKKLLDGSMGTKSTIKGTDNLKLGNILADADVKADTYTVSTKAAGTVSFQVNSDTTGIGGTQLVAGATSITGLKLGKYTLETKATATADVFDFTLKDENGTVVASKSAVDTTAASFSLTNPSDSSIKFTIGKTAAGTYKEGSMSFGIEGNYTAAGDFALKDSAGNQVFANAANQKISDNDFTVKGFNFNLTVDAIQHVAAKNDYTVNNNSATLQIGANESQSTNVGIQDMSTKGLKIDDVDLSTRTGASAAITKINDAIERVSSERATLGAKQNRLEHTIANLNTSSENLQSSESRIRDVDMAKEMMNFSKNNILSQAAQAMLAQANQQPQGVLQLLR